MKNSVEKYHGFYIGRYETSNDGNDVPQIQKNKDPWTRIKWGESMTDLNGGAVEKSRSLYSNNDKQSGSKYAVSTLTYGVQWDQTVRWLEKNYPGISKNSSVYGNFITNLPIKTGSIEDYKLNNIYDMPGNVLEWTMEAGYAGGRVRRGYSTQLYGRYAYTPSDDSDSGVGFRISLYIK